MPKTLRLAFAVLLCVVCLSAQTVVLDLNPRPLVLQKDEGELRTRRPRQGVSSPASEFLLKIGPKTSGSKHLLLFN